MAKINIEKMSVPELMDLRNDIDDAIERRRESGRAELKKKIAEMAETEGFSIDELFGKTKGKKSVSPPKYRNPANPSQTWSGRGRKPGWLDELLSAGRDQDEFLIR